MRTTKIEWADRTWNVVTGCTKVSEGCRFCFAERMARRLAGRAGYSEAPNHFDVTLRPDRLDQPLRWKKPSRIFVCSMGDLFHADVSGYFQDRVMGTIGETSWHTYQILTKRPERMLDFVRQTEDQQCDNWRDLFPNVWLGVSVENQQAADERIPLLLQTPAAVRFVSVEPMLAPIDLSHYWLKALDWQTNLDPEMEGPGWIIIGCESGSGRRLMELGWAADLVAQCQAANVPVFVKQLPIDGKVNHYPAEWPEALQVREYPE